MGRGSNKVTLQTLSLGSQEAPPSLNFIQRLLRIPPDEDELPLDFTLLTCDEPLFGSNVRELLHCISFALIILHPGLSNIRWISLRDEFDDMTVVAFLTFEFQWFYRNALTGHQLLCDALIKIQLILIFVVS